MADKLSWSELRKTLAERAGVSEKEANAFLNALNTQLQEGLRRDKQVKINGLGTFRLQAVAPRKSVNVQSGEEMTIEGYNKVSFSPEAGVKELIEKGSAAGSATASGITRSETDPLQKLGAQAEEIVDILGELGQGPRTKDEVRSTKDEVRSTMYEVRSTKEEEGSTKDDVRGTMDEVRSTKEDVQSTKEEERGTKEKGYHFVRDTLICVVILLLLLLSGYFFLRERLSAWIDTFGQQEQVESVEPAVEEAKAPLQPQEIVYTEFLTTEKLTYGSRLAWLAYKHYGDKRYWPYIYDANKERLSNPSYILVGTPVRVPKLSAEQMDTTNAQTRVNLEYLRRKGEAASRRQ